MVTAVKSQANVEKFVTRRVRHRGGSRYDSVVLAGNGIGALTFAARLGRDPRMHGRVTVVAPPVEESRRLLNGVSVRGLAMDFLCAALGVTHERFLDVVAGPDQRPVAYRQMACMADRRPDGRYVFSKIGTWQGSDHNRRALSLGVRNSRLVAGIRELMSDLGINWVHEKAQGPAHLRELAAGANPLIVNGTTNPTLLGATASKPKIMALAVQAPMLEKPGATGAPLRPERAYAPLVNRDGGIDVGYYTPFKDPLSPRSTWYGIYTRPVYAASGFSRESQWDTMADQLAGVAEAFGLELDDPHETMGRALIPASSFWGVPPSAPGTFELRRCYSGGVPSTYADGIVSAAIGGVAAAEAVLGGVDPDPVVRSALRPVRWINYLWTLECMQIPTAVDKLLRRSVRLSMTYPHSTGIRWWASGSKS